jgi:hypothetical protein
MTNGATPIMNNEVETKIKKRIVAEVIATLPAVNARLRKNVTVYFSNLKMIVLIGWNAQLSKLWLRCCALTNDG